MKDIRNKNFTMCVADFETTTFDPDNDQKTPEIYSWGFLNEKLVKKEINKFAKKNNIEVNNWNDLINTIVKQGNFSEIIKKSFSYGINGKTFISFLEEQTKDISIYFHNGGKFDLHFLISELGKAGYTDVSSINKKKVNENFTEFELIKDKNKEILKFKAIVDNNHKIISLEKTNGQFYKYKTKAGKQVEKKVKIKFGDSNLLFPSSIAKYGSTLNDFYKTKQFDKSSINYDKKDLYSNIKDLENDGNELFYLQKDCEILLLFLLMMDVELPRKKWKLTAAATTYDI